MRTTRHTSGGSDATLLLLERAVRHPNPHNRYARQLIRRSQNRELATSVARFLGNYNASELQMLRAEGIDSYYCYTGAWLRCDLAGLLVDGDERGIYVAFDTALRTAAGNAGDTIAEEEALLAEDPAAVVRTAYALARDLAAFDVDPALLDDEEEDPEDLPEPAAPVG